MTRAKESNGGADIDLDAIMSDMNALKRDFARLTDHIKQATDGAGSSAAERIEEQATRAYEKLQAQGDRSVKAVRHQIEERPVVSLLIAFAIGLVASRLLSR